MKHSTLLEVAAFKHLISIKIFKEIKLRLDGLHHHENKDQIEFSFVSGAKNSKEKF